MDNHPERYRSSRKLTRREERQHRELAEELELADLRMEASQAVATRAMTRAQQLDGLRHELAGDDPTLHNIMIQLEGRALNFFADQQDRLHRGWLD